MIWLALACAGPEPEWVLEKPLPVLRFSAVPGDREAAKESFDPLATHLSRTLGVPVHHVVVEDYATGALALEGGDLGMAWLSATQGAQLQLPGAHPVARGAQGAFFVQPGLDARFGVGFERKLQATLIAMEASLAAPLGGALSPVTAAPTEP